MRKELPADALADLRPLVEGPVLVAGEDGYDAERVGFDLSADHHPALVVGATRVSDVQAAVRFATRYGFPVAVQATGHGPTVRADGAVMINTRRMDEVRIAPLTPAARIDAGVRWRQVIDQAAKHGLAPLNGSSSGVGAVSYTLGGGLSPIGRTFGYSADHVRRIEIVTADGKLRHVTPENNADLFWALRGGKGNFGVVTSIEVDLLPVPRLYGGGLYFAGEGAAEILYTWLDWTRTVPEEMTSSVALMRIPDMPIFPEPLRGRFVVHVRIGYVGPATTGERLVRPLRAVAPPIIDTVGDMPYADVDQIHNDPTEPLPAVGRNIALGTLDRQAIEPLLELAGPGKDWPVTMTELRHLGGALSRPPRVPNAVGNRDAGFVLITLAIAEPGQTDRPVGKMEELTRRMAPWSTGGRLLNFILGPEAASQVRDAYSSTGYDRLASIKAAYDPDNLFRVNPNIQPTRAHLDST